MNRSYRDVFIGAAFGAMVMLVRFPEAFAVGLVTVAIVWLVDWFVERTFDPLVEAGAAAARFVLRRRR